MTCCVLFDGEKAVVVVGVATAFKSLIYDAVEDAVADDIGGALTATRQTLTVAVNAGIAVR